MKYSNFHIFRPDGKKTALVTGGTGALGSAIVRRLASDGWQVAFQYRSNDDKAAAMAAESGGLQGTVKAHRCDLGIDAGTGAAAAMMEAVGPVDLFVHCASTPIRPETFSGKAVDSFAELAEINVSAFNRILAQCLPPMMLRQNGTVIGVLSEALIAPTIPGWSAYVAAKMALAALLRDLALEVDSTGVRVLGILPGAFVEPNETLPHELHQQIVEGHLSWPTVSVTAVAQCMLDMIDGGSASPNGTFLAVNDHQGVRFVHSIGVTLREDLNARENAAISTEATEDASPRPDVANEVADRLNRVFRQVLQLKDDQPLEDARLGSLPNWDSLRQLDLLMSIERSLGISFSDDEISSLTSFTSLFDAVLKKFPAIETRR